MVAEIDYLTAFSELIENALEALSTGSGEKKVEVVVEPSNRRIVLKDNGIGMDENNIKRAVHVGAPKKREVSQVPLILDPQSREWLSAQFGRYGIGLICAFKFGDQEQKLRLTIQSKKATSEGMNQAVLDYAEMLECNVFELKIQRPPANPELGEQGTILIIENVDECFFTRWHEKREEWARQLASKYWLYLMHSDAWKDGLYIKNQIQTPPVQIIIDDTKSPGGGRRRDLTEQRPNCVESVISAHLEAIARLKQDHNMPASSTNKLHKWFNTTISDENKRKASIHILLYYFPVHGGEHMSQLLVDYSPFTQ